MIDFKEAQPSGLDLFNMPPVQTACDKVYYQEVRSNSQRGANTPIEFVITGQNGMEYVDLQKTKLYVKCKIQHGDGSPLSADESVGPVNLLLQSLFSHVDITMQGKLITSATSHYPYKAYIQTLLSYGSEAKESQLTSQLWEKDLTGHFNDVDPESTNNTGLFKRSLYFKESKTVDMEGPLYHDLFVSRFILNQVAINVNLYPSRPEFYLLTKLVSPNLQIHIEDIVLKVCKVLVSPAVIVAQSQMLQSKNALYPFTKTQIMPINMSAGLINFNYDNIFNGMGPSRVVIGFVDSEAVAGSYQLNPFNFEHFNLNQICLFVDNVPVSVNVMKLNFDRSHGRTIIPAFNSLFSVTNKSRRDAGNDIDRASYASDNSLHFMYIVLK